MAGVSELEAKPTLAETIARSNLHNDPLRFVLAYIDGAVQRIEAVSEREPVSEETIARLTRVAAVGANASVVEMIRAIDRRGRWIRASWWLASVIAAAGCGYAAR